MLAKVKKEIGVEMRTWKLVKMKLYNKLPLLINRIALVSLEISFST